MRTLLIAGSVALLAACGPSADETANQAAANSAQPRKKPAHCFFKDHETRGWTAIRGKDGDISVKGEAFRSDSRYRALLAPPAVTGATAELSPAITINDTGYAAPENWWKLSATIPNSGAVETVNVTCGGKTVAELKVPPKS